MAVTCNSISWQYRQVFHEPICFAQAWNGNILSCKVCIDSPVWTLVLISRFCQVPRSGSAESSCTGGTCGPACRSGGWSLVWFPDWHVGRGTWLGGHVLLSLLYSGSILYTFMHCYVKEWGTSKLWIKETISPFFSLSRKLHTKAKHWQCNKYIHPCIISPLSIMI